MSDSPQSNTKEVEQGAPSPEDDAQMNDPQDPHSTALAYEFEVKEQDRWLPIANGTSCVSPLPFCLVRHDSRTLGVVFRPLKPTSCACMPVKTPLAQTGVAPPLPLPTAAHPPEPMSRDSPSKSPEAQAASSSSSAKNDRYDGCDANIRNFAPVARIMKNALPDNAKIAKEAKECMQECVSEFISFITSEASEKCHQEKRKTVNGEDILFAMTSLGFENYSEALKIYLAKYREQQSQSNRGENQQNRPNSQGYGAAGGSNPGPSAFPGGDLGGQPEGGEGYNMYSAQPGHNGAGGEY